MNCENVSQLEESFLLGELEEAEMKAVREHLASCLQCRQRLGNYEELLGRMFSAINPVAPAPQLKVATLNRLAALDTRYRATVAPRKLKPSFGYLYGGIAAAFLVGLVIVLFGQVQTLQTQLNQNSQLLSFATSANTASWTMTPPGQPFKPGQPVAKMLAAANSKYYYVSAAQLPKLPAGQVYRVWYRDGNQPEFVADLQPDQNGNASLKVADPSGTAVKIKSCFITVEKIGSPNSQPSGQPILEWDEASDRTASYGNSI